MALLRGKQEGGKSFYNSFSIFNFLLLFIMSPVPALSVAIRVVLAICRLPLAIRRG